MGLGVFVEYALRDVEGAAVVVGCDVCFLEEGPSKCVRSGIVCLADGEIEGAFVWEDGSGEVEIERSVGKDYVRCWSA